MHIDENDSDRYLIDVYSYTLDNKYVNKVNLNPNLSLLLSLLHQLLIIKLIEPTT